MADSEYDIECSKLTKSYGPITAVSALDLRVAKGERFGLIGPDGAGKTSLMRILCGLIRPDSGRFTVCGYEPKKHLRNIKTIIGYMPQKFSLYPDLTVSENLKFFADLFGVTGNERRKRQERLLAFSRLDAFGKRRAGALSGGMKQKLALSCALIHTPRLLILDEPTTGVDPVSRREFWVILKELSENEGTTIFVSTPYLDEAVRCDRIAFMSEGKTLTVGTPAEIMASYPYPVVKVTGEQLFALRKHLESAPFTSSICMLGDHLRVSLKDTAADQAVARVRELFSGTEYQSVDIRATDPMLEDIFVYRLLKKEATS